MIAVLKEFFREYIVLAISGSLTVLFFLISLILIAFNSSSFSPPLIFHFDQYHGADFFGGLADLWLIVSGVLLIIVINFFFSRFFFERERFFTHFLFFVNLLISVIFLIAAGVIISVN
jgi:FlaA1/EpsC-like NDP-sugar epimerase